MCPVEARSSYYSDALNDEDEELSLRIEREHATRA
jgi:hypothetical protein